MFWSKKKSIIEQIREREAKEKEWEDIPVVGARSPEQKAEIEAKRIESGNEKELEQPRKEREKEEKAEDGLKLVIDTAKLECKLCSNPQGLMKVNYDTPTIQGKKTATVKEKSPQSLVFMGTCSKSAQSSSPCASVMQLGDWKDIGTSKSQEERVLLQKSTIKCNYGGIDIKIADSGQINEPESITATGAPVPENLDDKYLVSVYYNDTKIEAGSFVFISATPTMPKIKIEIYIGKDCKYKSLRFRLKTEFKFKASATLYDRNDVDYFPSKYDGGDAFIIANIGKTNWEVDFRGLYRGGTATVEIWNEDKTSILNKFIFYIRGKNPTKETVRKYMYDMGYLKYWPVYRMILHESGSEFHPVVRQFWDPEFAGKGKNRKEVIYGPSGRMFESKGIPNYGEPDGWGMCQIDFTYEKREKKDMDYITKINKNPDYIWNWKENISIKMNKKISDKLNAAKIHLEKLLKNSKYIVKPTEKKEGKLTYRWCPTTIPELSHLNKYMPQKADNSSIKSFLDAEFIKLYNGGHYVTDINNNGVATFKDYEEYKDIKISYVEKIGNINE